MLRPKLGRIWGSGNTATRRDPGDTKYITGWLAEIPTYQVLNYLQWKTDATIQALAERGVFEWGSDVTYNKGAAVWDESGGLIYVSLLANPNTTKRPSQNLTQWAASAIQLSRKSYDDSVTAITNHIADVTSNPHKLTPALVGTYSTSQIDTLVAQYRAEVASHAANKNNPHKLTAAIIGAVPVTGGKYTGQVTMGTGQILLSSDGTQLVKADANGVYLQNSAGSMGIDSAGKGFVTTGSNKSEIITAATFAANKQAVEPNYGVPAPVFYMPFIRDINIYTGGGTSTDRDDSVYDSNGRYIISQIVGSGHGLDISTMPLLNLGNTTIALDIQYGSILAGDTGEPYSVGFGPSTGRNRIYMKSNGVVAGRDGVGLAGTVDCSDLAVHRVVMRVTPAGSALFIDGVLAVQYSRATPAVGSSYNIVGRSSNSNSDQLVQVSICNFRAWDIALTDAQISNL